MNERLTLQDLIDLLAKRQEITKKDAENFLRELFTVIAETIEKNDSVKIKDFGTFKLVKVNSRKSVNVNTGEAIEIAAHYKLSFTPDKMLREAINLPFAHFESVILEDGVSFEDITIESEDSEEGNDTELNTEDRDVNDSTIVDDKEIIEIEPENQPFIAEDIELEENISESSEVIEDRHEPETTVIENEDSVSKHNEEETKNIEEIESSDDDDEWLLKDSFGDKIKRNSATIAFVSIIVIIVGVLMCYVYFTVSPQKTVDDDKLVAENNKGLDSVMSSDSLANISPVDSLAALSSDTLTSTTPNDIKNEIGVKPEERKKVEEPKPIAKAQSVKIEPGTTLRLIGLKYYGHKSFWVYIYQENKDKIKNPNNVALGTVLSIPPREKYGIDPKNPESIKKAKAIETKIFREFNID